MRSLFAVFLALTLLSTGAVADEAAPTQAEFEKAGEKFEE